MPDVIHGHERRPLVRGRSLFDEADELALVVPASCRRSGRCHECIVEVRSGGDQLSERAEAEAFLRPGFRLACQARIERADRDVDLVVLRRRLRILTAPEGELLDRPDDAVDPAVAVHDGRVVTDEGKDLGPFRGRLLGLALDVGTTTVVFVRRPRPPGRPWPRGRSRTRSVSRAAT